MTLRHDATPQSQPALPAHAPTNRTNRKQMDPGLRRDDVGEVPRSVVTPAKVGANNLAATTAPTGRYPKEAVVMLRMAKVLPLALTPLAPTPTTRRTGLDLAEGLRHRFMSVRLRNDRPIPSCLACFAP